MIRAYEERVKSVFEEIEKRNPYALIISVSSPAYYADLLNMIKDAADGAKPLASSYVYTICGRPNTSRGTSSTFRSAQQAAVAGTQRGHTKASALAPPTSQRSRVVRHRRHLD